MRLNFLNHDFKNLVMIFWVIAASKSQKFLDFFLDVDGAKDTLDNLGAILFISAKLLEKLLHWFRYVSECRVCCVVLGRRSIRSSWVRLIKDKLGSFF